MLQDPSVYPEPSVFRPERYIASEKGTVQRDPTKIAFGFGRRSVAHFISPSNSILNKLPPIRCLVTLMYWHAVVRRFCPGRHLAQNSVSVTLLTLSFAGLCLETCAARKLWKKWTDQSPLVRTIDFHHDRNYARLSRYLKGHWSGWETRWTRRWVWYLRHQVSSFPSSSHPRVLLTSTIQSPSTSLPSCPDELQTPTPNRNTLLTLHLNMADIPPPSNVRFSRVQRARSSSSTKHWTPIIDFRSSSCL